jgi:hypothetical protein
MSGDLALMQPYFLLDVLKPQLGQQFSGCNRWQGNLACGKVALPPIAGFARPLDAQNPQSLQNENCCPNLGSYSDSLLSKPQLFF